MKHTNPDQVERQEFLTGLEDEYHRLRSEPERWESYQVECDEWEPVANWDGRP